MQAILDIAKTAYLDPPERANAQIQALDRTRPGLPPKKGRAATMTHE